MTNYEILGIEKDATQEQIKVAYRTLAKKYHPDVNDASNAAAFFRLIQEAYETLGNPQKRAEYDDPDYDQSDNYEDNDDDDVVGFEVDGHKYDNWNLEDCQRRLQELSDRLSENLSQEERLRIIQDCFCLKARIGAFNRTPQRERNLIQKFFILLLKIIATPFIPIIALLSIAFVLIDAISVVLSRVYMGMCVLEIVLSILMGMSSKLMTFTIILSVVTGAIAYGFPYIVKAILKLLMRIKYNLKEFVLGHV